MVVVVLCRQVDCGGWGGRPNYPTINYQKVSLGEGGGGWEGSRIITGPFVLFVCHSAGDSNHSVIVWMEVEVVVVVKENSHKLLGQTLFRRREEEGTHRFLSSLETGKRKETTGNRGVSL